VKSKQQ